MSGRVPADPHVVGDVGINNGQPDVFVNLTREAEDCVSRGNDYCTKEKATEFLEKYTDTQSYVNGMVGLAISGNWDSVLYDNHNYLTFVSGAGKLYYVAWDLDQTLNGNQENNHALPGGFGGGW